MSTASSENTLKIFDMKNFKTLATLKGFFFSFFFFVYCYSLLVYLLVISGHADWVWECQWSLDSNFLMSCSSDSSLKLWDVKKGAVVRSYTEHQKTVSCFAFQDREKK